MPENIFSFALMLLCVTDLVNDVGTIFHLRYHCSFQGITHISDKISSCYAIYSIHIVHLVAYSNIKCINFKQITSLNIKPNDQNYWYAFAECRTNVIVFQKVTPEGQTEENGIAAQYSVDFGTNCQSMYIMVYKMYNTTQNRKNKTKFVGTIMRKSRKVHARVTYL